MTNTNFGLLTDEQKTVWSKDFWTQARNMSFVNRFMGKSDNSLIQRITELKKTEKGARAVITLVADMEGDGTVGDRQLEGNEEQLTSYDRVITIDQMRNANKHEGTMAEQASVVSFREESRNKLAYWAADRIDQLAFLTLSGVSYAMRNNGVARIGSPFPLLDFAADVAAPSAKRVVRWNGTTKLIEVGGATSDVTAADLPMWEMLVQLKAYAKETYMRGIRENGNEETYHVFLTPTAMAKLKLDDTYMQNLRQAQVRGKDNPLFTDSTVKIDGMYLHEFRHVYNTRGAASGSKWGAGGAIDGCQVLFCGAQAMGMADLGVARWVEKGFDYDNQQGISIAKIVGMLKPQFPSQYMGGTTEDHGVISCYVAQ